MSAIVQGLWVRKTEMRKHERIKKTNNNNQKKRRAFQMMLFKLPENHKLIKVGEDIKEQSPTVKGNEKT